MAKFDALEDADVSKVSRIIRDKAKVEEVCLNVARARLAHASADLSAIVVARFGSSRQPASSAKPKLQDDKKSSKFMKRKMLALMDGWKDPKGVTLRVFTYRYSLY